MKIRANDKVKKLYMLAGAGLITGDEILKIVEASKEINPHNHLEWTLEQFSTLSEIKSDLEVVKFILTIGKKKKWPFRKSVLRMPIKKYFEILKFARNGIEDICNALQNIKQPELSSEMRAAGFGKLDFGDLGIARTVGEFENIGTIQAYSLQMHVIIKSLSQKAGVARCEKAHQDIIEQKSQSKKYR